MFVVSMSAWASGGPAILAVEGVLQLVYVGACRADGLPAVV